MGGVIIETESERLLRQGMEQGKAKMIVELGQEDGLNDEVLLNSLQKKLEYHLKGQKNICMSMESSLYK